MYFQSLNRTLEAYGSTLDRLRLLPLIPLYVANRDLHTGDWTRPGAYALTDKTYARLLHEIATKRDAVLPLGLRQPGLLLCCRRPDHDQTKSPSMAAGAERPCNAEADEAGNGRRNRPGWAGPDRTGPELSGTANF